MKKLLLSILSIVLVASASSIYAQSTVVEGSKKYITKKVDIDSFKHLVVAGSPTVVYTQTTNGKTQMEIYGPDNIVPLLEADVKDNKLTIKFKKNTNIRNMSKFEVRISAPAPKSMAIQGSGDIVLSSGFKASKMSLSVQGSGDIDGKKISCDELEISVQGSGDIKLYDAKFTDIEAKVSGSGDIYLSGSSKNANFGVNGSGDIKATDLKVENVQAKVNGSGDIRCHAIKTLKGSVNGSGSVKYKGDPEITFSKKGLKKL